MRSMFSGCSSLISLDISNFNTDNVNDFASIFSNTDNLENINLLNYHGIDIFGHLSNYEKLTININNYNQINNGNNTLKAKNVKTGNILEIKLTIFIIIKINEITDKKYEYINKIFFGKNKMKYI